MKIDRLIPLAGALLLVATALGGPVLADSDFQSDDGTFDCDRYEGQDKEDCEEARKQYENNTSSSTEDSQTDSDDIDDDADRRDDWDREIDARQGGFVAPSPVMSDLPSHISPDVDARREFYQDQAERHRSFHENQSEERRDFFENQSEERDTFVTNLTEGCLNATAWDGTHVRNMSNDEIRTRLQADENATEECIRDLRAFLMRQQEEREAFLEEQREAHAAFHDELEEEREAFRAEQRQRVEERADEEHREWKNEKAAERPEEVGTPVGAFEASDGRVDGSYVSFNYTAEPAALADVSVKGIPLFEAAALDAPADHQFDRGASFTLAGDDGAIVIHDNPAVAFQIQTEDDVPWTLDVAPHLTVNATEDEERWEVTDGDNLHGFLHFANDPAYDEVNETFTGDDPVRFVVAPEEALTTVGGDGISTQDEVGSAMRDAMAKGTLGAELNLVGPNATGEDQTIVYDDLDVSLEESEAGRVRFIVDGELETGRTVVVNAPDELFESEKLSITYTDILPNGTEEEVPIRLSQGVRDVMNPNDDSTPEYLPARGANGWQVMVSVPHFSAHAVTIQSVTAQAPPSIMAGALAAVGFLAFAGVNLFRRRAS